MRLSRSLRATLVSEPCAIHRFEAVRNSSTELRSHDRLQQRDGPPDEAANTLNSRTGYLGAQSCGLHRVQTLTCMIGAPCCSPRVGGALRILRVSEGSTGDHPRPTGPVHHLAIIASARMAAPWVRMRTHIARARSRPKLETPSHEIGTSVLPRMRGNSNFAWGT